MGLLCFFYFSFLFFPQHDLSLLVCLHLYCQARVDSIVDLKESYTFITVVPICEIHHWLIFMSFFFCLFNVGFVHSNKFILLLIHGSHYFDASLKGYGMILNFTYLFFIFFHSCYCVFLKMVWNFNLQHHFRG